MTTRRGAVPSSEELVSHGAEIAVTAKNVFQYVHRVATYKMNVECAPQLQALLQGFSTLIRPSWVQMFAATELQLLIGGERRRIDVANLRDHCHYAGGYHPSQPYIQVLLPRFLSSRALVDMFVGVLDDRGGDGGGGSSGIAQVCDELFATTALGIPTIVSQVLYPEDTDTRRGLGGREEAAVVVVPVPGGIPPSPQTPHRRHLHEHPQTTAVPEHRHAQGETPVRHSLTQRIRIVINDLNHYVTQPHYGLSGVSEEGESDVGHAVCVSQHGLSVRGRGQHVHGHQRVVLAQEVLDGFGLEEGIIRRQDHQTPRTQ